MENDAVDRAKGVLLGLAAGDRNGGPMRMALRLAESILEKKQYNRADVIERYKKWYQGPPNDEEKAFDTGNTFARVFYFYSQGMDIDCAAQKIYKENNSAGINAGHRVTPLACLKQLSYDELLEKTRIESEITHVHPLSVDIAICVNILCRALIEGETFDVACSKVRAYTKTKKSFELQTLFGATDQEQLNKLGFAPDVLKAALYFVQNQADFGSAITKSVEFAGSANYCPVLVGSIAGAKYGASAISPTFLEHIPEKLLQRITKAAEGLAVFWK
eukprot:TRINITY_DN14848_c0_g1_i1.p1 TRINITY_DN14848_c0_g1~~TRINITY_DN14848_c0_g1_i1.p1  ORF type:complete len:275 (-),score=59.94 TRINITY_DN14848_c0_g1_i1:66-890(-)